MICSFIADFVRPLFLLLLFLFVVHLFSLLTCSSFFLSFNLSLICFRLSLVANLFLVFTCPPSIKDFVYSIILSLFSPLLFACHSSSFACCSSIKETQFLNANYIHYFLRKFKSQTSLLLQK